MSKEIKLVLEQPEKEEPQLIIKLEQEEPSYQDARWNYWERQQQEKWYS